MAGIRFGVSISARVCVGVRATVLPVTDISILVWLEFSSNYTAYVCVSVRVGKVREQTEKAVFTIVC